MVTTPLTAPQSLHVALQPFTAFSRASRRYIASTRLLGPFTSTSPLPSTGWVLPGRARPRGSVQGDISLFTSVENPLR
jgi:hypothetical protein